MNRVAHKVGNLELWRCGDSGGENASGEFYQFCEDNGIDCQFVIDSVDVSGIEVDDIYTGGNYDSLELLTLLHKVFN